MAFGFFKKEKPLPSFAAFGGGAGGLSQSAARGAPGGIDASGGHINEWQDSGPGIWYRSHVFTCSGTLTVNSISTDPTIPSDCTYFVSGGGGGGGQGGPGPTTTNGGGGGGGGGCRTNHPTHPQKSPATYALAFWT